MKDHVRFYNEDISRDGCGTDKYQPKLLPGKMLSVQDMKPIITKADRTALKTRPKSLLDNAAISYCWLYCMEYAK